MVLQWQTLKPVGKKSLRFKPLPLNLGYNLGYQKMAVICSSVQETAIALLVMLLMPFNGCIYVSILATLLKQNPISPPSFHMIHSIKCVQTTQMSVFQVYWKMFSLLQEVYRT